MKVYLVGHKGWIGQMVQTYLSNQNISFCFSNFRGESQEILNDILEQKPTHVFCCLGRTHGTFNGKTYSTIDYLQHHEKLFENINDNLYVPIKLSLFCKSQSIHFTYLGTGCIYSFEKGKDIFTEKDRPNFFGSNYSVVKGFTHLLMDDLETFGFSEALHLRIRMPITSQNNPRNFITKIVNYEKICSIPNSMSVLDELIPIAIHMMKEEIKGTFNFTNPGVIEHNQILQMYREFVDPKFTWNNFTLEEQNEILLSKRSNNELDTTKLEKVFSDLQLKYSYLILNPIQDAVQNCLIKYK
jgi:hypothetical protein